MLLWRGGGGNFDLINKFTLNTEHLINKKLLFYSQHWTRLANIQTNTQARLELTKQGLQSFFERDPYNLEQNLL